MRVLTSSPYLARVAPYLPEARARLFWLRNGFRLLAVTLAGLHAWTAARSHSMNPDGVAYLDIGDAYFRGDWAVAISTVWSPLYAWILGAVMWLVEPSIRWEFPLVHLVNFFIFLLALAAFEFMWRQFRPVISEQHSVTSEQFSVSSGQLALPEWGWWGVGYALFIWAALNLIQVWAVTPDMLMAAFLFGAAGLLAQIRAGRDSWHSFALMGCLLGLGCLSKAIMMPVSLFFLAAGFLAVAHWRRAVVGTAVALLCFMIVAGPFIGLISVWHGRFTYGDAGKFTYVRHVNHITYPHWQGEPPGDGVPLHPSSQIFDDPPIYEFATPIGGTYPVSLDQTYWYEGVIVRFDLGNQLRQLLTNALRYADLFVYQQAAVLFGLALLYSLRQWGPFSLLVDMRGWLLSGVGLLGLLLYAPVLVAGRYVGAFILLFWSDLLAQVRVPDTAVARHVIRSVTLLMILFTVANVALFNLQRFAALSRISEPPGPTEIAGPPAWPGAVAEELWQLGIAPGDQVAVIGYAFDSYWARLARVKIVAETLGWQADALWLGEPAFQQKVLATFAATGARAVVAEHVPPYAQLPGWRQVGESNFHIYLLEGDSP
jgi:hypothetical protein